MEKVIYVGIFFISTWASLFLGCGVVYAETKISTDIVADTTWTREGGPYIVQNYVNINKDVTLSIDPGVDVKFSDDTGLQVYGTMHVNGTANLPASFSSVADNQKWVVDFLQSTSTLSYLHVSGSNDVNMSPVYGQDSDLKIDHLDANGLVGPVMFNNSTADISSSNFGNTGVMLDVYSHSNVVLRDSTFHDVFAEHMNSAIMVYDYATLTLQNVSIENMVKGNALAVYMSANVTVASSTLTHGTESGVLVYMEGVLSLKNTKISDFALNGLEAYGDAWLSLDHSLITNNDVGLEVDGAMTLHSDSSSIYNNKTGEVTNYFGGTIEIANIWWGDPSGPYNEVGNPSGLGNDVGNKVTVAPWLTVDPLATPKCCSNVAFIPGLEASRLYAPGLLLENKLWEPNRNADVEKLYMNASGASIRNDVYTRDIVGYVGLPFWNYDIYSGFVSYMDGLVAGKTINAWKALTYDWRLGLGDIVNGGVEDANGNISYISSSSPAISYMILSLNQLSHTAKNGKVTLVTHSNGGLVAKALIQKLQDLKTKGQSDLIDHIDKVVMVAAPQLGAADAVASLLHGYNLKYLAGLVLDESHGRAMAENMPGAYNLLPTQKYFDQIKEPIVSFATSTDSLNNFSKFYGRSIADYATFKKFLTGADGRKDPTFNENDTPNVLSENLLANAETQHVAIDNWQFPASIEVTQVAGWGVETLKGVQYVGPTCNVAGVSGQCNDGLTMNPIFSLEGDGTVLYPSATESQGKQLYFNMAKYNAPDSGTEQNRKHENILDASSVEDLVKNILIGTSTLPQYISSTKPTAKTNRLLVSITASTTLSAQSVSGKHTGLVANPDPTSDIQAVEQNIPNSFYANFGGTKYIGLDASAPARVTFQGGGYGAFTVSTAVTQGDDSVSVSTFTDIPVTPNMQGEILNATSFTPVLVVDVDGDGAIDATTTQTQVFDPILYLEIMKKTVDSFNLKKTPEKVLLTKLNQLENLIKKGKIKNVEKQIQKFTKRIDRKNNRLRKISDDERNQIVQMLTNLTNNLL